MDGKVVFEGKSKKGRKYLIRYPILADVQAMTDFINTVSLEQTFIRMQGEQQTLEDETKYLAGQLARIEKHKSVQLLVFSEEEMIGISAIDLRDRVERHEGIFGMFLSKECRGEGIGRNLMQVIMDEAARALPDLKIVTLGVFANNPLAIELYQKFGFKEFGRLPKGILHKGKYVDHIHMYKNVRGF